MFQVPACSSNQFVEDPSCCKYFSYPASFVGNTEVFNLVNLPDLAKPSSENLEKDLSAVEATPLQMLPSFEPSSEYTFDQFLEPQVNLSACRDLAAEHFDLSFLGLDGYNTQSTDANGFFENFPTDMFDYFQYSPRSSEQ
ncbi:hypothetical protein L6164_017685 [Bauhinia variegata]|uniref:Uncharacterized protein n=1 Tax=Bauhinia variegata TaxID=167791 RepID=A0ACB9N9F5_BAUVA|nr:hypothetical protein L6164_017685 [Bauhinia variegata]